MPCPPPPPHEPREPHELEQHPAIDARKQAATSIDIKRRMEKSPSLKTGMYPFIPGHGDRFDGAGRRGKIARNAKFVIFIVCVGLCA